MNQQFLITSIFAFVDPQLPNIALVPDYLGAKPSRKANFSPQLSCLVQADLLLIAGLCSISHTVQLVDTKPSAQCRKTKANPC